MSITVAYNYKSIRKMINHSLYFTVLLSVFCSQSFLINNNLFAKADEAINTGANIKQVEEQTRSLTEEKQRWESMLRQRYRNGAILTIADGVKHIRMVKYINKRPVKINIVEVNRNLNPNIEIAPQLASTSTKLKQRATIRTIASRNNSIAAVNGTYFKFQNGVPLGTLMINKKVYTGPLHNRVAMGIGKNEFKMAQVQFNSTISTGRENVKVDNINQPRILSTLVLLYTPDWGQTSPAAPKYGINLTIQGNKVTALSQAPASIPQDGYVISGPKSKLGAFLLNKKVNLDIKMTPEWENIDHIISGGPYLVKDGGVYIDVTAQKLNAITGKNPRTAIGYTANNEFIMVTVDGREHASVGMTLGELARMMKSFGCINAMNLDGGGSTVMYVQGRIVNSPAQKGGIPISNALTITERTRIAYDENNS